MPFSIMNFAFALLINGCVFFRALSHTAVCGIFQIVIFSIPTVYFFDLMVSIIVSRAALLTIETIKSKKSTVDIEKSSFQFFRVGQHAVLDWSDKKLSSFNAPKRTHSQ